MLVFLVDDEPDLLALAPVVAAALPPLVAAAEPEFEPELEPELDPELPEVCDALLEFEFEFDAEGEAEGAATERSIEVRFMGLKTRTCEGLPSQNQSIDVL